MPKSRYVNRKKLQKQRGIIELLEKRKNKIVINHSLNFIITLKNNLSLRYHTNLKVYYNKIYSNNKCSIFLIL